MTIYPCCPLLGVEMGSLRQVVYMLLRPKMLDNMVIVVVGTIVFRKPFIDHLEIAIRENTYHPQCPEPISFIPNYSY
jgi:hypothetical protein